MKVALTTLGCKVNHYETEAMRELFVQDGWKIAEFSDLADVYVINTCTVTQTSDTKSRQMIARAHRLNPGGSAGRRRRLLCADRAGSSRELGRRRPRDPAQRTKRSSLA